LAIVNRHKAKSILGRFREDENKKIVFTNGCFDILHRGHLELLQQAKALGDLLVVGLNTDASVKRIKSTARPFYNEKDRAALVDALAPVDLVVLFDEDTPLKLICELKPDILVKGGDYASRAVIGAKEIQNWGGKVIILPFLKGYGTSVLIDKIKGEKK